MLVLHYIPNIVKIFSAIHNTWTNKFLSGIAGANYLSNKTPYI